MVDDAPTLPGNLSDYIADEAHEETRIPTENVPALSPATLSIISPSVPLPAQPAIESSASEASNVSTTISPAAGGRGMIRAPSKPSSAKVIPLPRHRFHRTKQYFRIPTND